MAQGRTTFVEGRILYYDGTTETFDDLQTLLDIVYAREDTKTLIRQIEIGGLDPAGSAFKAAFDFNSLQFGASMAGKGALPPRYQKMLGEILLEDHLVTEAQLAEALEEQKRTHGEERIGKILVRLGHATAQQIYKALSKQYGIAEDA